MLLLRRHASTIMFNAKDDFHSCIERANKEFGNIEGTMAQGGDTAKLKCIHGYKDTLKSSIVKVQGIYDGYLQNFNLKDGSLI